MSDKPIRMLVILADMGENGHWNYFLISCYIQFRV
jgi:hypothetical protein